MSRSNPTTQSSSPVKRWISFSGKDGIFTYWDKDEEVKKELPYPINFLVLDQLATITGWSEQALSNVYSNEVHNINKEKFTVKSWKGSGNIAEGLYKEIKTELAAKGLKFTQSIYIVMKIDEEYQLCNIKLKGAAFGAWLEFEKNFSAYKGAISVSETVDGKKGAIEYKMPKFIFKKDVSEEAEKIAIIYDQQLQKYFSERDSEATNDVVSDNANLPPEENKSEEDDLPF
jgi:hypothetical protein